MSKRKLDKIKPTVGGYPNLAYRITEEEYQAAKQPPHFLSLAICVVLLLVKFLTGSIARVAFNANSIYTNDITNFLLFIYCSAFIQLLHIITEILQKYSKWFVPLNHFIMNINYFVTIFYLKLAIQYVMLIFGGELNLYTVGCIFEFITLTITRVYMIKYKFTLLNTFLSIIFSAGIFVLTFCIVRFEHGATFGVYVFTLGTHILFSISVEVYYRREYFYSMRKLTENYSLTAALAVKKTGLVRLENDRLICYNTFCLEKYGFLFEEVIRKDKIGKSAQIEEILPASPITEDYPITERIEYPHKDEIKYLKKSFFVDLENSEIPETVRTSNSLESGFEYIKKVNKDSGLFSEFVYLGTRKQVVDTFTTITVEFQLRVLEKSKDSLLFELLISDISKFEMLKKPDSDSKEFIISCLSKGINNPLKNISLLTEDLKRQINNSVMSGAQKEILNNINSLSNLIKNSRLSVKDAESAVTNQSTEPMLLAKTELKEEISQITNTIKAIIKNKVNSKAEIEYFIDESVGKTLYINKTAMNRLITNLVLALLEEDLEGKYTLRVWTDKSKKEKINFSVAKTKNSRDVGKKDGQLDMAFFDYLAAKLNTTLKFARGSPTEIIYQFTVDSFSSQDELVTEMNYNVTKKRNSEKSMVSIKEYKRTPDNNNSNKQPEIQLKNDEYKGNLIDSVRQHFLDQTAAFDANRSIEQHGLLTDPGNESKMEKRLSMLQQISYKVTVFSNDSINNGKNNKKLTVIILDSDPKMKKTMVGIIQDQCKTSKTISNVQIIECSNIPETIVAVFQCFNAKIKIDMLVVGGSMKSIPLSQFAGVICSQLVLEEFYQIQIFALESSRMRIGNSNLVSTIAEPFSNSVYRLMLDRLAM